MKQLKIKVSFAENNETLHTIHLGHQDWLKHKSKTFLKTYLRTYKKVLLDHVNILNTYNLQVYTLFRTFFFDFNAIETERITEAFNNFNDQYNWIFHSCYKLENAIIFDKINQSFYCLYDALDIMLLKAQKNKNHSLKRQVTSALKMVSDYEEKYEYDRRSLNLNRDYAKRNLKIIRKDLKKLA